MAVCAQPRGSRWGFRLGSCAAGEGTFSAVRMLAICLMPCPAANISKIRRTTGAVTGSGSRRWSRWPRARSWVRDARQRRRVGSHRAGGRPDGGRCLGQHPHAVTDTEPDQVPFLLGGAAEHPEQHLGRGRAVVDTPSDLREPQVDAEVLEQRVDRRVLDRGAERPSELADDDGVQGLVPERSSPRIRAVSGRRGQGTESAVTDVEILGHDLRAGWQDRTCLGDLAGTRRFGLLDVFGRDSTDEGEQQLAHPPDLHSCPAAGSGQRT